MFREVIPTLMILTGLRESPPRVPPCNNPPTQARLPRSLVTLLRLPPTHITRQPRRRRLTRVRSPRMLSTEERLQEASRPRHNRKGMSQQTASLVRCLVLALPPLLPIQQPHPAQQVVAIVTEKPTDTLSTGMSALPGAELHPTALLALPRISSSGSHLDASYVFSFGAAAAVGSQPPPKAFA
jgi:hypothetical protein